MTRISATDRSEAILAYLRKCNDWRTKDQIANALGWSRSSVNNVTATMVEDSELIISINQEGRRSVAYFKAALSTQDVTARQLAFNKPWLTHAI